MERHRIVVIGGGYAGAVAAARAAGRARKRAGVTLINPEQTFVQRVRLHQVATGQRIAEPALAKLCGRRVTQVRGWAESIDPAVGTVRVRREDGAAQAVAYDSLIVATGSTVDTETVPGVSEHAHALAHRAAARRLADALARAREGARVAVVGAGHTGTETATEIASARPDLRVRIVSLEGLGARFSPAGRAHLVDVFDRLGIEVLDGVAVQAVAAGALEPAAGAAIPFDLAVWCGGFAPRRLASDSGLTVGPRGGVLVDRRMRSLSHPEVLAAGDAAECPPLRNGAALRMTCQTGIPTGAHAADVVAASLRGREERDLDFGYGAWNISLGRKEGLIQWVDRADRPKDGVTRGRPAAWIKELVTAWAAWSPGCPARSAGRRRGPTGRRRASRRSPASTPGAGETGSEPATARLVPRDPRRATRRPSAVLRGGGGGALPQGAPAPRLPDAQGFSLGGGSAMVEALRRRGRFAAGAARRVHAVVVQRGRIAEGREARAPRQHLPRDRPRALVTVQQGGAGVGRLGRRQSRRRERRGRRRRRRLFGPGHCERHGRGDGRCRGDRGELGEAAAADAGPQRLGLDAGVGDGAHQTLLSFGGPPWGGAWCIPNLGSA
jgi:NADH dehydrogenase FAD-containing subunit